ncbi:MAG: hypothetical protein EZS28_040011, partial [Streblomastix strix]
MQQPLNNEEYEQIREGLIGLICVGDKIKVIVNTLGRRYNNIAVYTVVGFYNDEKLKMKDALDYTCGLPIKALEVYKGELYSWETPGDLIISNILFILASQGIILTIQLSLITVQPLRQTLLKGYIVILAAQTYSRPLQYSISSKLCIIIPFDNLKVNEGQLYIWRPPLKYYTLNDNDKLEMLKMCLNEETQLQVAMDKDYEIIRE